MRTIEETPKSLPDDHDGDPTPDSPLFPLLPSVRIFFAAFCRALIEAVRSKPKKVGF